MRMVLISWPHLVLGFLLSGNFDIEDVMMEGIVKCLLQKYSCFLQFLLKVDFVIKTKSHLPEIGMDMQFITSHM